jgi:hypothetical protein
VKVPEKVLVVVAPEAVPFAVAVDHVPDTELPAWERFIVNGTMYEPPTWAFCHVPDQFPATLVVDGAVDDPLHADAEIRSSTIQPCLNIGIPCEQDSPQSPLVCPGAYSTPGRRRYSCYAPSDCHRTRGSLKSEWCSRAGTCRRQRKIVRPEPKYVMGNRFVTLRHAASWDSAFPRDGVVPKTPLIVEPASIMLRRGRGRLKWAESYRILHRPPPQCSDRLRCQVLAFDFDVLYAAPGQIRRCELEVQVPCR